jgi:ankyrin repeat protein
VMVKAGGEALLNKTSAEGYACLHSACLNGHLEVVKALVKADGVALLNKTCTDGCSCLHSASMNGHLEVKAGAGNQLRQACRKVKGDGRRRRGKGGARGR